MIFQLVFVACHTKLFQITKWICAEGISFGVLGSIVFGLKILNMTKVIQMVKTSEDNNLWIIDFNAETNELTFRVSRNPKKLQTEKIVIKDEMIYTNVYFFHISFLKKFLNDNSAP